MYAVFIYQWRCVGLCAGVNEDIFGKYYIMRLNVLCAGFQCLVVSPQLYYSANKYVLRKGGADL